MCVSDVSLLLSVSKKVVSKSQTCRVEVLLSIVRSAAGMVSANIIIWE